MNSAKSHTSEHIFSDRFEQPVIPSGDQATRFLERISYGATAESLAAFEALGADFNSRRAAYLSEQLAPELINDSDCDNRLFAAGYTELDKPLSQAWQQFVVDEIGDRYQPVREVTAARLMRALYSRRQLLEMMVEFWHDHFNVYAWEFSIAPVFAHYDREVIRPFALGNFRQMLEPMAQSAAMMIYLDNRRSIGADFNENFARELLELHTMGAAAYYPTVNPNDVPRDGQGQPLGYCDNDVYEAARCLTGWTIRDNHWEFPDTPEYNTGEFLYYSEWHDRASKFFLGQFFLANQPAMADGRLVFDLLCQHRATAMHVCGKLAQRFVSDEPPLALVEAAADLFQSQWQAPDQIAQVLNLILSADAVSDGTQQKMRRPWESLIAALRKTDAECEPNDFLQWQPWGEFFYLLENTGHGPFRWPSPDGYPDIAQRWQSSSSLGQTWRMHSRLPLLEDNGQRLLPLRDITLAALPSAQRSANAIVDYWLARLINGDVSASRRQQLVDFMRQNAAATSALDFDYGDAPEGGWSGNDLSRHYVGARLMAMVSLIFTLPEYQQR